MRFSNYTVLELALVIRDSKANPNAYDRESRDALRRACRQLVNSMPLDTLLERFEHAADRTLAQLAYSEVSTYAKPAGYTSGIWT
jgi:hypothetical protein